MFHPSKSAFARMLLIALPLAGCGGATTIGSGNVASAQSAVRGAVEAGAEREPTAALHLKMARDQIARAHMAAEDGEEEVAAELLERAELDAELAVALARKAEAVKQAEQAQARAQAIQRQEANVTDAE